MVAISGKMVVVVLDLGEDLVEDGRGGWWPATETSTIRLSVARPEAGARGIAGRGESIDAGFGVKADVSTV